MFLANRWSVLWVVIAASSCAVPDDVALSQTTANVESQLTQLRAYNDATNNYYAMTFSGTFAYHRLYIDTDENPATGFSYCGLGARYLIENTHVYEYTGTGADWSWNDLGVVTSTINSSGAAWTVARSTLTEGSYPNGSRMCFETKTSAGVKDTSAIYAHVYSNEALPIHTQAAYNDGSQLFYQASFDVAVTHKHVFIDSDEDSGTGYDTGGIGANYMVENASVYLYTGDGQSWSWSNLGASNMSPSTTGATGMTTWTFARSLINASSSSGADLVWHGTPTAGGSSTYTAIYDHIYSGGSGTSSSGNEEDTDYVADTTATLKNPERGIYFGSPPDREDPDDFHTLVAAWLWLDSVCDDYLTWNGYMAQGTSPILNDYVTNELLPARAAGAKVVFRPRYDKDDGPNTPSDCTIDGVRVFHADRPSGTTGVAQLAIQKNHIEAIAGMLEDYKDVIGYIQAGYLGHWGEWNTASGYGPTNAPFLYSRTLRAAVIDYVLERYEAHHILQFVELRRPQFAREVLARNPAARVGSHNDCFMTNSSDSGTFSNYVDNDDTPESDDADFSSSTEAKNWALANLTGASFGGETCPLTGESTTDMQNPIYHTERWRDCDKMIGTGGETSEPGSFGMDYVNGSYAVDAVPVWSAPGGCYDEIRRKLGYRFEVLRVEYPQTVGAGQPFTIEIDVTNTGWSALHKPRTAMIVLRDGSTVASHVPTNSATATWLPGTTTTLVVNANAPSAGTYNVRLAIPDPDALTNTDYAVKLATKRGGLNVFDDNTGENDLGVEILVE